MSQQVGMSLRDHFAALAMAELVRANPDRAHHAVATDAYRQADAMLKARDAVGKEKAE